MFDLQSALMLSPSGYRNLKKAIAACTLSNFAMMLPFAVIIQIIMEITKPFYGIPTSWITVWLLFALGILAAGIIFVCLQNDYKKTFITSYMESEKTRLVLAEQIRKLPMSVFNSKDLAEITTNLLDDVATSEHVTSHVIPQAIANAFSISVVCILLLFTDWRMALAVFVSVPAAFGVIIVSRVLYEKLYTKYSTAKLAASGQMQEYIEGIKVIRACNLDGEKFKVLQNALQTMKILAIRMEFGTGVFIAGAQVILQAGIGITVLVGTMLLSSGQISFIPLLLFLLLVVRIYAPILVEQTLLPEFFYHRIAVNRLRSLMQIPVMEGAAQTPIHQFPITFENASFSYIAEGESAIRHVTTSFPAGGLTALVGPSGSGKSTLAKLIARFWDVTEGRVTLGGVDVKTLDPEYLLHFMSFVFQDVLLFNDTVYNNILIGNMNASPEQVMAAAEAARCDVFVSRMPKGYDTLLGENGATLSGGERQRLSIARALLKDAPIVIMDEPTASLDPESEAFIQQAISRLIKGKTVVVIAHRLRTIRYADKIIVLQKGAVVEEGTHDSLLAQNGLYNKLFTLQQKNLGWSVR